MTIWWMISAVILLADESRYYTVETVPTPEGEVIEVGGMDLLPDGSLALSTRRGRVWIVENPTADNLEDVRWHLFADGLAEGLGLKVVDGEIYVIQRTELSRLRDIDGDRTVDHIDVIAQDWGVGDNYHEYAFGLPHDEDGNFYLSLNLAFHDPEWWHGQSREPWRGWVLKVGPDGTTTPFAYGLRSPSGMGRNIDGDLFVTDNQGDWMPVCPIFHIQEGGFYGHPASLRWTEAWRAAGRIPDDRTPVDDARQPAAVWIPYDWSRSAGNLVPDRSGGQFGPFAEQLFVAELTNGMVLRADLEKVNGQYQGAVWPFRKKIGSICRIRFAEDGTLFTGLTNRGWGGMEPGHGLRRIRWTGEIPLEMSRVHLQPDGFVIKFTRPLVGDISPEDVTARSYCYNWWWEYGSPEQDQRVLEITETSLSADRQTLTLKTPDLEAGRCVRVGLRGVEGESGHELLHPEFSYTINQLPGQRGPVPLVARRVAPPASRGGALLEGWVRLTWGDPLDRVSGAGWRLGGAELDERGDFSVTPGNALLVNDPGHSDDLVLPVRAEAGQLTFSMFLPRGGGVGIGLSDGRRVVFRDQATDPPSATVTLRDETDGVIFESPVEFWFGPGQWQDLSLVQDEHGLVTGLQLDDVPLVETELWPKTRARETSGPLRILGDIGPAGVANLLFRARTPEFPLEGRNLVASEMLGRLKGEGEGSVELRGGDGDVLIQGQGVVRWPAKLPADGRISARLRFAEETSATLELGPAVQIHIGNGSPGDSSTGSMPGIDTVTTQLVPDDAWFDLVIRFRSPDSTQPSGRIVIAINGVTVAGGPLTDSLEGFEPAIQIREGRLELEKFYLGTEDLSSAGGGSAGGN